MMPYAITMWDFSWLERRWPGAGFEDWDQALGELVERGYDTVRIDAYPHLVAAGAERTWELLPQWNQQDWGAPALVEVQVLPALVEFIAKAREHGVRVALSTWFRQDRDDVRMRIDSPEAHARVWSDTLRHLRDADVLDTVRFVDLCNEFPLPVWAPFLYGGDAGEPLRRSGDRVNHWTSTAIRELRREWPDLDFTFSVTKQYDDLADQDVSEFDLLEPHLWMASSTDFYQRVGYGFERFETTGYENVVARALSTYRGDQERYDRELFEGIDRLADWSRATGKPLVTTECWSIVDYKDWPGLDWGWVKELNERAVRRAAATGRWAGLATSNFCSPQFRGMWRDVAYHRRLTDLITSSPVDDDLVRLERSRA